jgi:hypothetical protein
MRSTVPGLLILLSLLLGGCAGGAINTSNSGVSVWLDQSPDGWTLPLAPFTLKAHASDSDGSGITSIAFLVSSGGGAAVNVGSVTTDASQDLVYAELIWNPAAEGEYLIQAQAFSDGGSQISQTARICISAGSGVSDALGNTCVGYNPPPDILALPTLTSTPTIVPRAYILTVLQNANCREGPGTVYPVVNSALAGQLVQVLGKNADQTWWYSQLANDKCWISNVAGTPSGDLSLLPIIDSPPTPVPTETEVVTDPDDDGDGYPFSNDCNDKDPTINPGAVEIKDDKIDSNCNGDDNT